jgi:hypothetical protein
VYFCAAVSVWIYGVKIRKMFRRANEEIWMLERSGLSMAMFHLKKYRITQDCRKRISEMEKKRKFIIEKCLFIRKSSLKTQYENMSCITSF